MPVDTAKVEGRRSVEYHSLDDVVADADRLTSGPLKTLGNWSAGQIFRHLATAVNGSIDGFKSGFPWFIRVPAKLFKKKLLNGAMPPGLRVPPKFAQEVMPPPTTTEEGLAELRAAVAQLQPRSTPRQTRRLRGIDQRRVESGTLEPRQAAHELSGSAIKNLDALSVAVRRLFRFAARDSCVLEILSSTARTMAPRRLCTCRSSLAENMVHRVRRHMSDLRSVQRF